MHISEFDYDLPDDLIAQKPLEERQGSRMLIVERKTKKLTDAAFADFPSLLMASDVLVINNTRVFPARLFGRLTTGAAIEIFLIRDLGENIWEALARPGRRLKPGKTVLFDERLQARVVEKLDEGKILIEMVSDGDPIELIDEIGVTPLPPYIRRDPGIDLDSERYQTVFAKNRGAIAAPTAGLHFTPQVFADIRGRGVSIAEVTLHVGYGTFEPVRVDDMTKHSVSAERYEIDENTAEILNKAKAARQRIVAVGTTTTRALEANFAANGEFVAGQALADLTVTPGYEFRAIDALLTNFHLPQSSLLVLTSSFGGHELVMDAYRHAVRERYRFYSYGDCMLIV